MKAVKVKGKKLNKVKLTLFITPLFEGDLWSFWSLFPPKYEYELNV